MEEDDKGNEDNVVFEREVFRSEFSQPKIYTFEVFQNEENQKFIALGYSGLILIVDFERGKVAFTKEWNIRVLRNRNNFTSRSVSRGSDRHSYKIATLLFIPFSQKLITEMQSKMHYIQAKDGGKFEFCDIVPTPRYSMMNAGIYSSYAMRRISELVDRTLFCYVSAIPEEDSINIVFFDLEEPVDTQVKKVIKCQIDCRSILIFKNFLFVTGSTKIVIFNWKTEKVVRIISKELMGGTLVYCCEYEPKILPPNKRFTLYQSSSVSSSPTKYIEELEHTGDNKRCLIYGLFNGRIGFIHDLMERKTNCSVVNTGSGSGMTYMLVYDNFIYFVGRGGSGIYEVDTYSESTRKIYNEVIWPDDRKGAENTQIRWCEFDKSRVKKNQRKDRIVSTTKNGEVLLWKNKRYRPLIDLEDEDCKERTGYLKENLEEIYSTLQLKLLTTNQYIYCWKWSLLL